MVWPDVQPPAYAVPNPTRNPPTMIAMKPLTVSSDDHANTSCGARPLRSVNPKWGSAATVPDEIAMCVGGASRHAAIAPRKTPDNNARLQARTAFQTLRTTPTPHG